MSAKIGFLSANTSDIQTIEVIKEDVTNACQFEAELAASGDLQSTIQSEKAQIRLEFDYYSQANLGALRKVLQNRKDNHKIYIKHPADAYHETTFDATVNECWKQNDMFGTLTNYAAGTEFDAGEYTTINAFNGTNVSKTTTDDYVYMFFKAKFADFVTNHGVARMQRLTLAFRNLFIEDTVGGLGFKIDYLDNSYTPARYVEIKRQGYTLEANNTLFASVRPVPQFSSFTNALDGNNFVIFRIRNLYPNRTGGNMLMQIDYAKAFVNAFGCVWDGHDGFTYDTTFDGGGQTGSINLIEL